MSDSVNLPVSFKNTAVSFTSTQTTIARVLVDVNTAATGAYPKLFGGSTILDLTASSTDSAARDVVLYTGEVLTTQATTPTGSLTATSSTVVRANAGFIADGWRPGDLLMVFAPLNAATTAADGILCQITSMTDTTLTLVGTPLSSVTFTAGSRVVRVSPYLRATIAAVSGTNGTSTTVGLLNHQYDGSYVRNELKLGANGVLIVALQATMTAALYISIAARYALY